MFDPPVPPVPAPPRALGCAALALMLTLSLTRPANTQENSEQTRPEPPPAAVASPLDIAPPREISWVAQPIRLPSRSAAPVPKHPKTPRRIVIDRTEVPTAAGNGWPEEGPVNSRAADARFAQHGEQRSPGPLAASPSPAPISTPLPQRCPAPLPSAGTEEAKAFCAGITDKVREARAAADEARLRQLEGELRQRIVELEARKAELRQLVDQRIEADRKAGEAVVAIFSKMRPEAAAIQLAAADESMAAALLSKLNPRGASAILNEMDAAKAARLTAVIAEGAPKRVAAKVAP